MLEISIELHQVYSYKTLIYKNYAFLGAMTKGNFKLKKGDTLHIAVGQKGNGDRSGSGGSFVSCNYYKSNRVSHDRFVLNPLIVSGGAAGSISQPRCQNGPRTVTITGVATSALAHDNTHMYYIGIFRTQFKYGLKGNSEPPKGLQFMSQNTDKICDGLLIIKNLYMVELATIVNSQATFGKIIYH